MYKLNRIYFVLVLLLVGCATNQPQVIVITSTPAPQPATIPSTIQPTQVIVQQVVPTSRPEQYIVQAGDTLTQIADQYNVPLAALINLNQISNPNLLEVGQVLQLPSPPTTYAPNDPIIRDAQLVRSADSIGFDIATFMGNTSGYVNLATDSVDTQLSDGSVRQGILSALDIVTRVSVEYSVDARLLLAFLEYRAGWLTNPTVSPELIDFPLISETNSQGYDRKGLYKQLSWLADRLNRGFYDAKYQELDVLTFSDGAQLLTAESVNAGTLAVQYVLSLNNSMDTWLYDVSSDGFKQVYLNLFGSETIDGFDLSPIPAQPTITLPFRQGDVWRLTGGFHGGWGSGSAWSALDFAPPDDRQDGDPLCYVSEYPVVAVADGVIARSSDGAVVLDLDGDGDERTGWTIFYLHLDIDPAITTGTIVQAGASLGKPSCHGGFSTATHLHIARRYNGEWVPLDCEQCDDVPPFIMGEWQAVGYTGQEYQGYMVNLFTNQQVIAEQARNTTINEISW